MSSISIKWPDLKPIVSSVESDVKHIFDARKKSIYEAYAEGVKEFTPDGIITLSDVNGVYFTDIKNGDFTHYFYEGRTMGPNFPITKKIGNERVIVGWYSKPGVPKTYNGGVLDFKKGEPQWDKAFEDSPEFSEFLEKVEFILSKNYRGK